AARRDPAAGADHGRRRAVRPARQQIAVAEAGPHRRGRIPAAPGGGRAQGRLAEARQRPGRRRSVAMVSGALASRSLGRRGASSTGCLVSLLILVAVLYYGVNIGEVYFRYYRLLDEMQTQAQLAAALDDGTI